MLRFETESLVGIINLILEALKKDGKVSFAVPDPDLGQGLYAGEKLASGLIHRPWRVWFDLAEKLECRFLTPERLNDYLVVIHLHKLKQENWVKTEDETEKYGQTSEFSRIQKLEESVLLLDYLEALERIPLKAGARILSLGVNRAEEFRLFDYLGLKGLELVGLDHSKSALDEAKKAFPSKNYQFIQANINHLARLDLGKFDLIMALGTVQSPGIDDRALLRYMVQSLLIKPASLLLSFPNSKYQDGELLYGARMKNFSQADLSLLVKDAAFYKKYLQQHGFKVYITGKYYLLITATPA